MPPKPLKLAFFDPGDPLVTYQVIIVGEDERDRIHALHPISPDERIGEAFEQYVAGVLDNTEHLLHHQVDILAPIGTTYTVPPMPLMTFAANLKHVLTRRFEQYTRENTPQRLKDIPSNRVERMIADFKRDLAGCTTLHKLIDFVRRNTLDSNESQLLVMEAANVAIDVENPLNTWTHGI
jgi:hypothetical protein